MYDYKMHEKRRRARLYAAMLALTVVALLLGVWLLGPSPPTRIRWATGPAGGSFEPLGRKYQELLDRKGLHADCFKTRGSVDNLQLLLDRKADVAFVHGGAEQFVADPDDVLRGLATIHLQPLWVFCRRSQPARALSDMKGWRIAIGPEGSGSDAVARHLLAINGISAENTTFVHLEFEASARALRAEKAGREGIDAAVFLASYDQPWIGELLDDEGVVLLDFSSQGSAYRRRFPYLAPMKLYPGLFDLENNIPDRETTVLSTAAMLVSRKDLDPRVVEQLLKAAQSIHSPGDLLDDPGRFPALEGMFLPVHDAAETYMKSGESYVSRLMPYWAVRWIWSLQLLVLPLIMVWLPFLKIIPMVYNYRVTRLLRIHYGTLRDLESGIAQAESAEALRHRLRLLEELRTDMEWLSRKVPAHLQGEVYQWRLHVLLVRDEALDRLRRLAPEGGPPSIEPPAPDAGAAPSVIP